MTQISKRCWLSVVSAVLFLMSLTPSSAQLLTYTTNLPTQSLTDTGGYTYGLTLPAFDSNLGTLLTVNLAYNLTTAGSLVVSYPGGTGGYGGTLNSATAVDSPSNGPGFIVPVFVAMASFGGGGFELPPSTSTVDASGNPTGSVDFTPVSGWQSPGGGNVSLTLDAAALTASGGGFPTPTFSTPYTMSETGTFTLTYTYAPVAAVPEPSSVALGMIAVGALAAFEIRQRRSIA